MEGSGGEVPPPPDHWTVPFLHGFHRRIKGRARGTCTLDHTGLCLCYMGSKSYFC